MPIIAMHIDLENQQKQRIPQIQMQLFLDARCELSNNNKAKQNKNKDLVWRLSSVQNFASDHYVCDAAMFSTPNRLKERTGKKGVGRFEYLQELVTEFQDTSSVGMLGPGRF